MRTTAHLLGRRFNWKHTQPFDVRFRWFACGVDRWRCKCVGGVDRRRRKVCINIGHEKKGQHPNMRWCIACSRRARTFAYHIISTTLCVRPHRIHNNGQRQKKYCEITRPSFILFIIKSFRFVRTALYAFVWLSSSSSSSSLLCSVTFKCHRRVCVCVFVFRWCDRFLVRWSFREKYAQIMRCFFHACVLSSSPFASLMMPRGCLDVWCWLEWGSHNITLFIKLWWPVFTLAHVTHTLTHTHRYANALLHVRGKYNLCFVSPSSASASSVILSHCILYIYSTCECTFSDIRSHHVGAHAMCASIMPSSRLYVNGRRSMRTVCILRWRET